MQILVLGGTGAMGIHIVNLLAERGDNVTVTSRQQRKANGNTKYIQGNAHDLSFLKTLLTESWDAIIDFMVYSTPKFKERVNDLLAATSQYVYLSSARVYADSSTPITEQSPRLLDVCKDKDYLNTDEYALTKARQEDILWESGKRNWTIIRPYITYSENRLQLGVLEKEEWLYRALKGRTIVFSKDISPKLTTLTYGFDVAKGIAGVIGNQSTFGEAFHITANDTHSWHKILNLYTEVLEKHLEKKPKVMLQEFEEFLEHKPTKTQIVYDRLYQRQFNNAKIANYISSEEYTTMENGVKNCLNDFLINPKFRNINWMAEAIKDRQTAEYTKLEEIIGTKNKIKYIAIRYFYPFYKLIK